MIPERRHPMPQQSFMGPLQFLVCGLPKRESLERLFLMMTAYVDDSGSEGKGNVMVLAGFIARAELWQEFSEDWKAVLNEQPRMEFFKAAEAHRRRGQFRGLSTNQRDLRVGKFADVIGKHKDQMQAVASIVWWEDFREFRSMFRGPVQAYVVLFQNIMWAILQVMRLRFPEERVEPVFDDQGLLGSRAAALTDRATLALSRQYQKLLYGRPVHRSDRDVPALQAADLLAWSLRRGATAEGRIDFASLPESFEGLDIAIRPLGRAALHNIAMNAKGLLDRFPDIESLYTEAELKAVRNKFLGYDPDAV